MKLAFFEVKGWEKRYLKNRLKRNFLFFSHDSLTSENVHQVKDFDSISIFIYSKIDEPILRSMPNLKLIITRSTGFDHIGLNVCKKHGITVCSVPSYGENTVAEHTFALILSLSRPICRTCPRLENNFSMKGLMGFDLKGKTLGVVGAGKIGLHVIRIAKSFGMNILAYDSRRIKILAEVLGFEYTSLEDLLARSNIITLHVPYNKSTYHLLNKESFSLMKKGAILINTARGAIVETEALIEALDKKILSGAGLDVIEGEELIKEEKQLLYKPKNLEILANLFQDHILLSKSKVVFTPHLAFYSKEALERILQTTVENVVAFVSSNS